MRYSMTANEICTEIAQYATRCVLEMRGEGFNEDHIADAIIERAHDLVLESGRQQPDRALRNRIICIGMAAVDALRKQPIRE
jgi:hypothetical protein